MYVTIQLYSSGWITVWLARHTHLSIGMVSINRWLLILLLIGGIIRGQAQCDVSSASLHYVVHHQTPDVILII